MKILRNLLSVILVHNTRSRARAQRHLRRENLLQFEVLERRWAPAVTFGVIGDYGVDNSNELAVANLVKSWSPDFVITTGDNGYNTTAADIDRFIGKYYQQFIGNYQGSYGPGAGAVNKFFPSAGNHDWDGGGGTLTPYTNYFTLPGNERYYDFVRGDVHFFVVSSDSREPDGLGVGSVQRQWLQSRLAASTAPWQVVYMHHPPYSSGANHGSTAAMQWPYQQWGADVVLAAHDHTYERIIRNDASNSNFPYFVNGTGGNSLYSFSTPVAGSQVRYSANWGAMRVTADATRMTFEFINVAGNVIDTYTISNAALPAVNIAATDANASEPGANTGDFTISRTGPTTNPLTVNYTRGGTATNAADYAALSGTVVIPAGAASAVIILTPLNDALVEGSETAILTLSASGAYTIGASSSATVTIADDDVASLPTVTIAATDANAAEPANTGTFTVSRTGSTTAAMTVNYTVNGTATRGSDYTNLSGVVTIPAGAASATIIVTPINDTAVEANETVLLALAAGAGYAIGSPNNATVTIADDDAPPTPEIVVEGNSVSIADGDKKPSSADHTDFGAAAVGGAPISRTLTIRNAGPGPLNVGQVTVPAGFTLTALPASNVAAGGTTQFTVRLDTATAGTESGDVSFSTNDSNENPFNFRITGKVGTGSAIASFTLINADTDGAIRTIANGDTINLAGLPTTRLNIRANTNAGPIESVRFGFDGNNNYLVDNLPPYALFSDQAGNYHPGTLSVGSHTLSATPFAADNASGNQGVPLSIAFSVINSATFFGDDNQDGIVDAADYVVWRKTFGATGLQPYSGADGNGDGDVDLDDLAVWKAHFGQRVAPPGSGSGTVAASSPSTPGEVPQETASAMVATQDSAGPEAPYEITPIFATPPVANAPAEMDSETTAAAESQSQVTAADETITTDDQSAVFDAAVEQSLVAHDEALVSFHPSISFATNQPIDTDPRETRSARTVFAPTAALISGRETIVASRRTQRALVASREIWTDIAVDKLLLLPAALSTDEKADLESALPRPARRHEHMTHAPALDDVYDDLERDSWRRHRAKTPMAVV